MDAGAGSSLFETVSSAFSSFFPTAQADEGKDDEGDSDEGGDDEEKGGEGDGEEGDDDEEDEEDEPEDQMPEIFEGAFHFSARHELANSPS